MNTDRMLEGRAAIITGSTRGNGQAMARLFSQQGASVVVTGREESEARRTAAELTAESKNPAAGFALDVTSSSQVKDLVAQAVDRFGRIDILVNNAGYPIKDEFWDVAFDAISDESLTQVLNVDAIGTYRCCREVLPVMVKQSRGVIINISSTPAIGGYTKGAPYTVAKSAILGITKHVAAEYGKYNIRCNAIAPGSIATPRNWDRLSADQKKELVSGIPLGREGKPEDVAGVALMLASDYTSFVNGQTIIVDGGETMR
ncbi:MAG: SDR family NAD(P)-dependent oxidoreductase [Nitrososphaera sp.]|jgi:3-oxoacyl-[acyl-carrier protein] reductase